MSDKKLDFNLNFLNTPEGTPSGNFENDWEGILSCIEHLPTKVLLQKLAIPIGVSKSEVIIAFKSPKIADMVNNSNKIQYIKEASNKFYNQSYSNIIVIDVPENYNNSKEDSNKYTNTKETPDSNSDEEQSFTKIKYNDEADINWKPIIFIFIIVLIGGFISFGINEDKKRNAEISQIKNNAYEYLKNSDDANFNKELKKLSNYGLDNLQVKEELEEQYKDEIDRIISDIAYNYEHNREQFNALKQQYLPTLFKNNEDIFNSAVELRLGYKELSLKPVALPNSGVMHNYTGKEAIAPFEIKTPSTDQNFYIKLVDAMSGNTEVVIFMRGGETKKMEVPLGTYKIKRAAGHTWYGEEHLFGHNTVYTASDEWLTFRISGSYVEGHTLTLYKVANGNFSTKDIKAEDF